MSEVNPMETAPASGVILLTVEDKVGELRTFVAEASWSEGLLKWQITTGWGGWSKLHSAWTPIYWQHIPKPERRVPTVLLPPAQQRQA